MISLDLRFPGLPQERRGDETYYADDHNGLGEQRADVDQPVRHADQGRRQHRRGEAVDERAYYAEDPLGTLVQLAPR